MALLAMGGSSLSFDPGSDVIQSMRQAMLRSHHLLSHTTSYIATSRLVHVLLAETSCALTNEGIKILRVILVFDLAVASDSCCGFPTL